MYLSCGMHFRVNPRSIFAWMSRNSLLKTGTKSEVLVTAEVFFMLPWGESHIREQFFETGLAYPEGSEGGRVLDGELFFEELAVLFFQEIGMIFSRGG